MHRLIDLWQSSMRRLACRVVTFSYPKPEKEVKLLYYTCLTRRFDPGTRIVQPAMLLVVETSVLSASKARPCNFVPAQASRQRCSPVEFCFKVKLIQNAKLDARIDSEKCRVVMSKAPPSVYQQALEQEPSDGRFGANILKIDLIL